MKRLISRLHDTGAKVMIECIDTAAMRRGAAVNDIDLIQPLITFQRTPSASLIAPELPDKTGRIPLPVDPPASWAVSARV